MTKEDNNENNLYGDRLLWLRSKNAPLFLVLLVGKSTGYRHKNWQCGIWTRGSAISLSERCNCAHLSDVQRWPCFARCGCHAKFLVGSLSYIWFHVDLVRCFTLNQGAMSTYISIADMGAFLSATHHKGATNVLRFKVMKYNKPNIVEVCRYKGYGGVACMCIFVFVLCIYTHISMNMCTVYVCICRYT